MAIEYTSSPVAQAAIQILTLSPAVYLFSIILGKIVFF
jgi:hypothetical protein